MQVSFIGDPATYKRIYIVLLHVCCTEGGISGPGTYSIVGMHGMDILK